MPDVLSHTEKLTVLEAVKRDGISEDVRHIVEVLTQTNEAFRDAVIKEANEGTKNTTKQRSMLPQVYHRKINEGVMPSASQVTIIEDVIEQMTGYSEIDETLVSNQVNPEEFVNEECVSFLESMGESQMQDFIYGNNKLNSEEINGLAARHSKLGEQCINAGGTGNDLTSIYLVKWAKDKAHLTYPRGAKDIGVKRIDKGVVTVKDKNGKQFEARRNYFEVNFGYAERHPKSSVRICNIPSNITGDQIVKLIFQGYRKLASGAGIVAAMANSDILGKIDDATIEKPNVHYTPQDAYGYPLTRLRDIRLRQMDVILNTEDEVK